MLKKAKKGIGETKMRKYKVALNVDGIIQVTYTLHAYSADGAVYRAKVKACEDFGESKFNAVYVVEVKGE